MEIVCFLFFAKLFGPWYHKVEVIYILAAFSILFTVVALVTYAVIFWKYVESRDMTRQHAVPDSDRSSHTSAVQAFLKSRFYISVLIILTYMLFNTIPFFALTSSTGVLIPLCLGYTTDALIYIFIVPFTSL